MIPISHTLTKNWSAILVSSIGGFELIIKGLVNIGKSGNPPQLIKRENPDLSKILKLNLTGVSKTLVDENFQKIQYEQKIFKRITYNSVEIFHDGEMIANIIITKL